ncbi:unnamed protein product [Urochloa humidicola]
MASTVTLEKTTTIHSGGMDVGSPKAAMRSPLLMKGRKVGEDDVVEGKCCGHRKCELVSYDKLPEFLKHNEFIVDYYRSEWPINARRPSSAPSPSTTRPSTSGRI